MRVMVFGATGMIGQGLVRECLRDESIKEVVLVGRSASGVQHAKLTEHVVSDFSALDGLSELATRTDVCFWCLGVSSNGMSEEAYRRVTLDLTVQVARQLVGWNPRMTFVFVSGTGADSSGKSRVMWARVKGAAENAVLGMPFRLSYAVRPAFIQPLHGIRSRTALYRAFYAISGPLFPLLRLLAPDSVTTTEELGRAMLALAKSGSAKRVLEQKDLNALVRAPRS